MGEPSLVAAPGEPQRFTMGARTFLLRTPTKADRIKYKRALAEAGAAFHRTSELCAQLSESVSLLLPEQDRPAALARITEYRAASDAYGALAAEADAQDQKAEEFQAAQAELAAAERAAEPYARLVRAGDAVYAGMLADNAVYWDLAGLLAAKMFLVGWEGLDAPFPGAPVSDAAVEALTDGDIAFIGISFAGMLHLSPARRKNSDTASPMSAGAPVSTS